MFISKSTVAENGSSVTHHMLVSTMIEPDSDDLRIMIHSWPNEAARLSGGGHVGQSFALVPISSLNLTSGLKAGILGAILNLPRWVGGEASTSTEPTLQGAKERKWSQIKAERARREFGVFEWGGHQFDCDDISQRRITGATLAALIAAVNSSPFSVAWTLSDNASVTLSGSQMINVGLTLMSHVNSLHATSRALRTSIDESQSPNSIAEVEWPATP